MCTETKNRYRGNRIIMMMTWLLLNIIVFVSGRVFRRTRPLRGPTWESHRGSRATRRVRPGWWSMASTSPFGGNRTTSRRPRCRGSWRENGPGGLATVTGPPKTGRPSKYSGGWDRRPNRNWRRWAKCPKTKSSIA